MRKCGRHLVEYGRALFSQWLSRFGTSLTLLALGALFLPQQKVPKEVLWLTVGLSYLVASFGAWRAERKKTEPALQICFEQQYPYIDDKPRGPDGTKVSYKLFRVGVRNIGAKTVDALEVKIPKTEPLPPELFPPFRLRAMHDRPERAKKTVLHPVDEPWYFDVVDQLSDGRVGIPHTEAVGKVMPSGKYTVTITASGRDVPTATRQFVVSVPTPRQGNLDLQFAPVEEA